VRARGRAGWTSILALAVGASLAGLVPAGGTIPFDGCCLTNSGCFDNTNSSDCNAASGTFTDLASCGGTNSTCEPLPVGCCDNVQFCFDNFTLFQCDGYLSGATFVEGVTCSDGCVAPTATATATATPSSTATATATATPSSTPTATATATATATPTVPLPDGADCVAPSQCSSMFCVDGVCCESTCDGSDESCNVPGLEGNCLSLATAPAASNGGILLALTLLLAVALVALVRRRRGIS
jgi:hypothetical protein